MGCGRQTLSCERLIDVRVSEMSIDAVEELSGKKMQPSPFLSRDGLGSWGRRDPEALANMVRNEEFYDGQEYEKALNYLIDIEYPAYRYKQRHDADARCDCGGYCWTAGGTRRGRSCGVKSVWQGV